MKPVTIRFPEDVFEGIQREAYEIGASVNSYLMVLLHHGRKVVNAEAVTVSPALHVVRATAGLDALDHTDQGLIQEEARTCYSQNDAHNQQQCEDARGVRIQSEPYRRF